MGKSSKVTIPTVDSNSTPWLGGVELQRGLVWDLERKKALIDSIYRRIKIGGVTVLELKDADKNNSPRFGVIDGKQRLNAILGFIKNEFPDNEGLFWRDLSKEDRYTFVGDTALPMTILSEKCSDADIIRLFIRMNTQGIPQDAEHIAKLEQYLK